MRETTEKNYFFSAIRLAFANDGNYLIPESKKQKDKIMDLLKRKNAPALPVKVLQFGEGNFLRAFIDWMINEMNKQGKFNGLVQLVQPLPKGLTDFINAQDGLYTLILRGISEGKVVEKREVIESVKGCLNPYESWEATVKAACSPDLRFVFSNTTEAGIEHKPEPYTPGTCQNTYPAKLTSLMFERWKAFGGAAEKGVVFIPCELIDKNGITLKKYMLQYASEWNLPQGFAEWLEKSCLFINTLVDRIVAGYPRAEAEKICAELGYQDNLLDCGEIFHFFVMEGPESILKELPLKECGLNVVVTDNQSPYRTRKVRFLNGAHTADVLASIIGGLTFVDEMMNDPVFGKMVRKAIYGEIFHTVNLPENEKQFFADSIVERFLNPFAQHRLLSISLNSVSKWKVRVMPSLLDYTKLKGELPEVLAFSLAALLRFYRLSKDAEGKATASCNGISWPVSDSPDVIDFFAGIAGDSTADYVRKALANTAFWEADLNTVPGLTAFVTDKLEAIDRIGIREAVKTVL